MCQACLFPLSGLTVIRTAAIRDEPHQQYLIFISFNLSSCNHRANHRCRNICTDVLVCMLMHSVLNFIRGIFFKNYFYKTDFINMVTAVCN